MKTPPTPTPRPTPVGKTDGIISPGDYDQGAASWLLAVGDPAGTVLAQSFVQGSGLLSALRFSARQIARLVSTVGAATIKARFLVLYDAQARPHFSVALFATDALDARVSSYYLGQPYLPVAPVAVAAEPAPEAAAACRPSHVRALARYDVPNVLTQLWLRDWSRVKRVTPDLFATSYGPLRGYSYGVEEFTGLLRDFKVLDGNNVLLEFDLHEHCRTEPQGDMLVYTFGLLLWTELGKASNGGGPDPVNMGVPCPPSC